MEENKSKQTYLNQLKQKNKIIYNLQIKNNKLEILIIKQKNFIKELEDELNIFKIKDNNFNNLKEFKLKNNWDKFKFKTLNYDNKLEIYNKKINEYKNKNIELLKTNYNLRNENINYKKSTKEFQMIIENNNYKIKELKEVIRNLDIFSDNSIIKKELVKNYNCLKLVDNNYYNLMNILNNIN